MGSLSDQPPPTPSANRLVFLGTGGARFMLAYQHLATAGLWAELEGQRLSIDPGPGALVHAVRRRLDPTLLDGILLTHQHLDHSADVNALIEAMTLGGSRKRGALFCPGDALAPDGAVLHYLREHPAQVVTLEAASDYALGALRFSTTAAHKHGVETYGVRFHTRDGTVGLLTDTAAFDGLADQYRGCAVLVINVVLLEPRDHIQHLAIPEAEEILRAVRPEAAVLTHFGLTVWRAKPSLLAAQMSERLGLPVTAARDGMVFDVAAREPVKQRRRTAA